MKHWIPALVVLAFTLSACRETPVEPATTNDPKLADIYKTPPNLTNCSLPELKEAEKMKAFNYVNSIRALHGLMPVEYRTLDDASTASASLMCAANGSLSHTPPNSWHCWNALGADGCASSNLALRSWSGSNDFFPTSESYIEQWIKDSTVENAGHRRWLLDPFLKYVSFGRADRVWSASNSSVPGISAAAIRVVYTTKQDLRAQSARLGFVAYPYGNYPATLFGSNLDLSFSAVTDYSDYWKNQQVDYSNAVVSIKDQDGTIIPVSNVRFDTEGVGLPNSLRWKAATVAGKRYDVTVSKVVYEGKSSDYHYSFTLQTPI